MNSAIERLLTLRLQDVMTPFPIHVARTETVGGALKILRQHEISGAPVVDSDQRCIGVVSHTDLSGQDAQLPVLEVMSPTPTTLPKETPMMEGARAMIDEHIHRVVVVDEQGHPAGIATSLDIVAAMVNAISE